MSAGGIKTCVLFVHQVSKWDGGVASAALASLHPALPWLPVSCLLLPASSAHDNSGRSLRSCRRGSCKVSTASIEGLDGIQKIIGETDNLGQLSAAV